MNAETRVTETGRIVLRHPVDGESAVETALLEDRDISPSARLLYCVIRTYQDPETGECHAREDDLLENMGEHGRAAQSLELARWLRELRHREWIAWTSWTEGGEEYRTFYFRGDLAFRSVWQEQEGQGR